MTAMYKQYVRNSIGNSGTTFVQEKRKRECKAAGKLSEFKWQVVGCGIVK